MLFLIACSSIVLDVSASIEDTETTVPYPACYAACATLWTPAPECEQFIEKVTEPYMVTVEDCQSECALATGDADRNGIPYRDEWADVLIQDINDYGCYEAADRDGSTPCAKSGACPDE